MTSWPAANGIRCVKPSSAIVSPSLTCPATASASGITFAAVRLSSLDIVVVPRKCPPGPQWCPATSLLYRSDARAPRAPPVPPVAGTRHRGHPGVLARAPRADALGGRAADRHHPRDGAADPPHPGGPRPRALGRPAILADAASAHAGVGLPVVAEPVGDRAAADGGA